MPACSGNSCTAAFNSACCPSPRAGGTTGLLEDQSRRTSLAEGGGPSADGVSVPAQCLGRGRGGHAPAQEPQGMPPFSPGAPAPDTSCCAHQPNPTATAPSLVLSPSYPSPSPLSLFHVLTLCLPDSSRRICRFHLGFSPNPPNRVVRALERDLTRMETGSSGGFRADGPSSRPVAGEGSRSCSGRRRQDTLAGRFVRREWERPLTDW